MNKIIKELINFSHFAFVILGIMLLGLKLNINIIVISISTVLYITFILKKFELKEK